MPAARSTTSSEERLSIRKMPMVPISTAKGSTSSEKDGKRSSVIQASRRPGTSPEIVAGAAQHLDEVDEEDQHATDHEHRQHGDEEAQRKIARKRPRCTDAWHLRSHVACIPLPAQNFIFFGWNLSSKLSLDRNSGDILTCAAQAATRIAPSGIAYTSATAHGFSVDQVAGGEPCNPQAHGDAEGQKNLRPTALPRGAGMAEEGDGDKGEDEGVEGRGEAIVQFRANLPVVALCRRLLVMSGLIRSLDILLARPKIFFSYYPWG